MERHRTRYQPLAQHLRGLLVGDAQWFRMRATLDCALHPGTLVPDPLRALAQDAPSLLEQLAVADALQDAVADLTRPWTPATLLGLEAALPEDAGMLRLALVMAAGKRHGWSPALRARLGALRQDPVVGLYARTLAPVPLPNTVWTRSEAEVDDDLPPEA